MQPVDGVLPGVAFDNEITLAPLALSPSMTVPAVNVLEGLLVVLEKAEKVPAPATAPVAQSTSADASSLRARLIVRPSRPARAGRRGSDPRSRPARTRARGPLPQPPGWRTPPPPK